MGGGGLEQVGATHAVNELLLQSFERVGGGNETTIANQFSTGPTATFLRFFPGWPIGERASFKSIRAIGGFLVDGSVDTKGVVSGVRVLSTVGGSCTFLAFSKREPSVSDSKGNKVKIVKVSGNEGRLRSFATSAGEYYSIS
eukprot:SAG31_NODE_2632_length_5347_cov_2.022866_7_plen_142_part_00